MGFKSLFEKEFGFPLTNNQRELVEALDWFLFHQNQTNIFLLKGYAGTGKTSIIATLVGLLPQYNLRSLLMAPTGRAAKVLAQYANKQAYTCHKYLYFSYRDEEGNHRFVPRKPKRKNTVFIVDEASMISDSSMDSSLFSNNLLEDIINHVERSVDSKLILIGDNAQLPPIGMEESPALDADYLGRRFGINPFEFLLWEVVRQSLDSGVLRNASNIRYSITKPRLRYPYFKPNDHDFIRIEPSEIEYALRDEYSSRGIDEVVVITRTNKLANLFNNHIRYRILDRENEIEAGDHIICVKNNYFWLSHNNYSGFIANGDILYVKRIISYHEVYGVKYADIIVSLPDYPDIEDMELRVNLSTLNYDSPSMTRDEFMSIYNQISVDYSHIKNKTERNKAIREDEFYNALQVKFSYTLTAHKAQGGQWEAVFLEQGYYIEEMHNIEYLRWLYTAITRAKTKLYLCNFQEEFFV